MQNYYWLSSVFAPQFVNTSTRRVRVSVRVRVRFRVRVRVRVSDSVYAV